MAALLPTILTILIFVQCYIFIQENIIANINRSLVFTVVNLVDWYPQVTDDDKIAYALETEPKLQGNQKAIAKRIQDDDIVYGARIDVAERYWVHGPGQIAGFLIALIGVCFIGALLASVVGRTLWRFFEKALMNAPLIKKVYPYVKQVTDFLLAKKGLSFNKVVAIQYPRQGLWSIALVTGTGLKKVVGDMDKDFLTVFVPTSPTPFTGYVIMVAKDEAMELDMTIEQALRFTISGGVITPSEFQAQLNHGESDDV
jgi:uncharacterized membrane protein